MSIDLYPPRLSPIEYPDTDGLPMAENTLQFEYIVTIKGGLDVVFRDDENVFVAGDLFWYPVEGNNQIRVAPDILVALGRPKGHRSSYMQWLEDNLPPQVIFEILSPGNRDAEMLRKFSFYERYGVEEYYIYDPDLPELTGWVRDGANMREIRHMDGWVSPRLKVGFDMTSGELKMLGPNGRPFVGYAELAEQRDKVSAETERLARNLSAEQVRAEKFAAQLRALGVEPEA